MRKRPLWCRGGCGRQTAYVSPPPGSTLKSRYFGYCDDCKHMIKWGGGVKDVALLSNAYQTRAVHLAQQTVKVLEYKQDLFRRMTGKIVPG